MKAKERRRPINADEGGKTEISGGKGETETTAEEGAKTRNKGKRDTKTNAVGDKTQGTALCVGAHMPRSRVETGGTRVRGRSSNHGGDDGGTPKGNTNPAVDAKGEGGRVQG